MRIIVLSCILALILVTGCQGQERQQADTIHAVHRVLTDSANRAATLGYHDTALQLHKRALGHARKHRLQEHEARSLVHIGKLLKSVDVEKSLLYLDNALHIAERLGKHDLLAEIMLARSAAYKQQQNYKEALAALETHQRLLEKVFAKTRVAEAARLRAERQRVIATVIGIALVIIVFVFAFYYRRTRRLNAALKQSNQIKDTLFSIIGHDLRGPAGGIMQALEMVDAGLLDEDEQREVISLLKQQSRSFHETLNTLLNWAAAQLKGAQPNIASIDAMVTIKRSLDLLTAQAKAKDIQISLPSTVGLPVLADSDQLDFVVRNLVSNAIKFSYPGGQVDITASKEAHAAVIAVRDQGKGIPAAKQSQLLAEGQLSSTFGTKGEKGTGLGLLLSWDFIKANGGHIWFDSKENVGTTFYISLPLAV